MGRRSLVTFTSIAASLLLVLSACTAPPPDPDPDVPPTSGSVDVAVGWHHSCAVRVDGTVSCWGRNDVGQLGDRTTTDRSTPVQVVGIEDAVAVAAGGWHSCVLLTDGTVRCWGSSNNYQLGADNWGLDPLLPVTPVGLANVVEIVSGIYQTCARTAAAEVWCWGAGGIGQGSTTTSSHEPVRVAVGPAVDLDAGGRHVCAVLADTSVSCWGDNSQGQLGDGTTTTTGFPVAVQDLLGVSSVSAGDKHTCARLVDATAWCWGLDGGRLGPGSTADFSSVPVPVVQLVGARSMVAGRGETCARLTDRTLRCWGPEATDLSAIGATARAELSLGGHGCAVLTDGAVRCWGTRAYGQLGNGDGDVLSTVPVPVGALEPAADISSGGTFGCALLQSTRLRCWGQNDTLQLGNTRVADSPSPVPVLHYPPGAPGSHREELRNVVALETGTAHACALLSNGTMRCWGANSSGQIGVGSSGGTREPTSPSGIFGAVDISAGGSNSCAVLGDGTARCWGLGGWRIGSGTMPFTSAPTPLQVAGLGDATSIDTGQNHTCAVRAGGRVSCWGLADGGVLGQSVFLGSNVPLEIANLEGVVDVAAGGRHNCALLADGTVRCWGANDRGQLGNGWNSTSQSLAPVPVIGLEGAVAVTAGGDHSCAVLGDGSARCWGSNSHGQLGNGSRDLSRAPVEVLAPGGLADIDAGPQHTCAVAADAASWCWGANGSRQLGTGASFTSPPVQVVGFP